MGAQLVSLSPPQAAANSVCISPSVTAPRTASSGSVAMTTSSAHDADDLRPSASRFRTWVATADGRRPMSQAAIWRAGEQHTTRAIEDLTLVVLELPDLPVHPRAVRLP
jgi:hypothetical protein